MGRTLRKIASLTCLLPALTVPCTAAAGVDVFGQFTVATDYVYRGVSQTMSGAALQGELGFEAESGWYGFAWASNVKFTEGAVPDDGARVELNFGSGYSLALTERLTATIGGTYFQFPGTEPGFDYDYVEWHSSLEIDGMHDLTIGYSDNVFGSGSDGTFYALGIGQDVTETVGLRLELGHHDLESAYDNAYSYAELCVVGFAQSIGWRLSYVTTSDTAAELFDESTIQDRFVFALSVTF